MTKSTAQADEPATAAAGGTASSLAVSSTTAAAAATAAIAATAGGRAGDIHIEARGAAGLITFDRPRALNAVTTAMRAAIAEAIPRFARDPMIYCLILQSATPRAFSAGGDVRELAAWGRDDRDRARAAFAAEYRLNWALDCLARPIISLIDGAVMGSGVGLTVYGTHRVAGEGYAFAMPETAIGLFPDVGLAHVFARMPDEIGTYLGLTGRTIGRADAYHLGLVTHCIAATEFPAIVAALVDAQPVDALLDRVHHDPGPGEVIARRQLIQRCFSPSSVLEIIGCLEALHQAGLERDAADWVHGVLADLSRRSPTSLAITLRHLREARSRDLREVLEIDYRLACRCLDGHDFYEGVRAALIDKDGRPVWQPARLEDVTPDIIDGIFAPLGQDQLELPTRVEMQRV